MKLYRSFLVLNPAHVNAVSQFLRQNANVEMVVEVKQRNDTRSHEQNKRYWALLREISAQAWIEGRQFSDDIWHEHFKRMFLGTIEGPGGENYGLSTAKLNVSEFGDYMTQIEQYAAEELGVLI